MVPSPLRGAHVAAAALWVNVSTWASSDEWAVSLRHDASTSLNLLLDGYQDGHRRNIFDDLIGRAPLDSRKHGPYGKEDDDDDHKVSFHSDDIGSWAIFMCCFVVLLIFDHFVLHRRHEVIGFKTASLYVIFWVCCAGAFNCYVLAVWGKEDAFNWGSGYLLEWMLSLDNLFVFHLVFNIYGTPDHLKHKPLFFGIIGAIFFRLLFFVIGEWLFHASHWMHLIFGVFLIWTGIKAGITDEEDEDPTQHPLVRWMSRKLPLLNAYDQCGSFFVKLPIDPKTGECILPPLAIAKGNSIRDIEKVQLEAEPLPEPPEGGLMKDEIQPGIRNPKGLTVDTAKASPRSPGSPKACIPVMDLSPRSFEKAGYKEYRWRATMLVLVVVCLEITDLLFAVDSVSAIIAQIPDLYLAFTACVFAMLGLRATFFVIDELIRMFQLLKYGVAGILVFIGVKLIVSKMIYIPPSVVCFILFGTISACVVAQVFLDHWKKEEEALSGRSVASGAGTA